MAQSYTDDCFAASHVGQTDLQNMENNFAALKSTFSGTTQPSNVVGGMLWFDTTKKVLKHRNSANSAWLGLMHGDVNQKMLVYRNTAMDGWAIDSSIVADNLIAVKNHSSGTYTTAGAISSGSWTISGLTRDAHTHTGANHNHKWYDNRSDTNPSTQHDRTYNSAGTLIDLPDALYDKSLTSKKHFTKDSGAETDVLGDSYTSKTAGTTGAQSTNGITADGTWRPAAAVFTVQYLDI